MSYTLNNDEKERFKKALISAIAIPFIDDIEDYIVESIWAYSKGVFITDPFNNIRPKRLFDVTDSQRGIGWSVKSLQWPFSPGCIFELVIQRAAVFKKAAQLGFPGLSINCDPNEIGAALLEHWKRKVEEDANSQGVKDKRIIVLLKTSDKTKFSIYEDCLHSYKLDEIKWQWTNSLKNGLQGIRKEDNLCIYRWYPSQTQFFERFKLSEEAYNFTLEPKRLEISSVVDILADYL